MVNDCINRVGADACFSLFGKTFVVEFIPHHLNSDNFIRSKPSLIVTFQIGINFSL